MNLFLVFLVLLFSLFFYKTFIFRKAKNIRLNKFKNKLLSKESNIEKIFLRDEEKTSSNPNININIGIYENEENINIKSNIHRARLSKFRKSKFNGEMIYLDEDQKIFKYVEGKKFYL